MSQCFNKLNTETYLAQFAKQQSLLEIGDHCIGLYSYTGGSPPNSFIARRWANLLSRLLQCLATGLKNYWRRTQHSNSMKLTVGLSIRAI
jgi:hypothetical protein